MQKRFQRRYWHEPRGLLLLIFCALIIWWRFSIPDGAAPAPDSLEEGLHEVRRVVDGDTLLLESGARVRLQGIDTPETVWEDHPVEPWGPEASQFTKDFVEHAGRRLRLTFSLERKDRHDRFLAFAWNGGVMLNEELVREGLAHVRLDYRYSGTMKKRLAKAEDEARRAGRGIWSDRTAAGRP